MDKEYMTNVLKKLILGQNIPITTNNFDFSWDLPNKLNKSNMSLFYYYFLTVSMPQIDLSNDANDLKEISQLIVQLDIFIQNYILQQITLQVYCEELFSEIMQDILVTNDNSSLDSKMQSILGNIGKQFVQSGGAPRKQQFIGKIILMMLFVFLLGDTKMVIGETSMTSNVKLNNINVREADESFNILQIPEKELLSYRENMKTAPKIVSGDISVSKSIVKYDTVQSQELNTVIGTLKSFLYSFDSGSAILKNTIEEMNAEFIKVSSSTKDVCLNMVQKAYTNGIFDEFLNYDDFDNVKYTSQMFEEKLAEKKQDMDTSKQAVALTTAASLVTGDIYTPLIIASNYVSDFFNGNPNIPQYKPKTSFSTTAEKEALKQRMLDVSKIYCLNSFHIALKLEDEKLSITGDKITYNFIVDFITLIQKNIDYIMNNANNDKTVLSNLLQKFEILKYIVQKLDDVVNFDTYSTVSNINEMQVADPLQRIQDYLKKQNMDLNLLLEIINADFPVDKFNIKEREQLTKIFQENVKKINDDLMQSKQFDAEERVRMNSMNAQILTNITTSWVNLNIVEPMRIVGSSVGKVVTNVPLSIAEGGIEQLLGSLGSIGKIFYINPGAASMLLFLSFCMLLVVFSGPIYVVKESLGWFVFFVKMPFIFVYHVSYAPTGMIVKHLKTLMYPEEARGTKPLLIENEVTNLVAGNKKRTYKKRPRKNKRTIKRRSNKK